MSLFWRAAMNFYLVYVALSLTAVKMPLIIPLIYYILKFCWVGRSEDGDWLVHPAVSLQSCIAAWYYLKLRDSEYWLSRILYAYCDAREMDDEAEGEDKWSHLMRCKIFTIEYQNNSFLDQTVPPTSSSPTSSSSTSVATSRPVVFSPADLV